MLGRHRRTVAVVGALAAIGVGFGGLATGVGADRNVADTARAVSALGWDGGYGKHFAFAKLMNAEGDKVGTVALSQWDDKVLLVGRVRGAEPGFHGFHVHSIGKCEAPAFTSAGGHLAAEGTSHPGHMGDLPSLSVDAEGEAVLITTTDRFSLADLRDEDGAAMIVHAGADNYANIPDRYDPDPDEATLGTGDAGSRFACGVIQ